jgi:uncharacterized damage-inducible protein DinB
MDTRLRPLWAMLELNTDLVLNCLDGLSEADGAARPGGGNSIAFLVAHLVDTRHFLAAHLGEPAPNPLAPLLADARSVDDLPQLPRLDELAAAWRAVSAHLATVGPRVSAATLDAPGPQRLPGTDGSRLEGVAFLVQHDSYHIGQIAMLRRRLGYPAMRYDRRSRRGGPNGSGAADPGATSSSRPSARRRRP